jgi:hypothetical protein
VFTEPSGTRAVSGAVASSSAFNELIDDLGEALTDSLTADGDKVWTGDQDADGHTVTGLQTPVAATDAATKGYVDGASGLSAKLAAIDALNWTNPATPPAGGSYTIMCMTDADSVANFDFFIFGQNLVSATGAAEGRTVLGLGDMAVEDTINNGNWSGTDLQVVNGGTGASDAAGARTNLGLDPYAGTLPTDAAYPIGSYLLVITTFTPSRNATVTVYLHTNGEQFTTTLADSAGTVAGTWRVRGRQDVGILVQRVT